jgi:hypothetical protein
MYACKHEEIIVRRLSVWHRAAYPVSQDAHREAGGMRSPQRSRVVVVALQANEKVGM